ncbi:MAG: YkgJ family cysteine cluster protein [Myxococcota bacterium]
MTVETLSDARWSCRGCSDCCRGLNFGPVEPEIINGLKAADIAALWPPAAAGPWFHSRQTPSGETIYALAHRDDHCVFLQDNGRCAVHRLLGGAAKPWFCREYPFFAVNEPDGRISVAVRGDCGGLHESYVDGQPLTEQLDEILSLPRIVPRQTFSATQIVILPGLGVGPNDWKQVEPHLLRHLSTPREPEDVIRSARQQLFNLINREAPLPNPVQHRSALGHILSTLAPVIPSPAIGAALNAIASPMPQTTEPAQRYLNLILRGEILTKRFAALGSLPALMGWFLVQAVIARRGTSDEGPLSPQALAETLPTLKRLANRPTIWAQIQALRPPLEHLFQTT